MSNNQAKKKLMINGKKVIVLLNPQMIPLNVTMFSINSISGKRQVILTIRVHLLMMESHYGDFTFKENSKLEILDNGGTRLKKIHLME